MQNQSLKNRGGKRFLKVSRNEVNLKNTLGVFKAENTRVSLKQNILHSMNVKASRIESNLQMLPAW